MTVRELFELDGQVVLITGGSRGLGLQMASALGEMGAKIAICARKPQELEVAAAELERLGIETFTAPCDLANADELPPLVEAVLARFGRIDVLVNNAGASWARPPRTCPSMPGTRSCGSTPAPCFS